ncbi:MAG TPA: cation diffusion facilitator family transporter [Candidatus Lachnoclostridium stercorigallinarum]|uniref:Cation diffusion facilitator family transporter n=1 Tax=Candidatus Lachnoclostridium stercorigallinarum TaxID=2838634 RepID=A0A9D2GJF1_9FIRM|nr:cation diffusion facilitator family transporter [Candidatus Lachnoclostridium stercorigallinarum]
MTEFLIRRFVKDYEKVQDVEVRTRYGALAGMVGICCNLILFAAKMITGILAHSISVMADAFNNLSDAASSIISIVGVKMAEKPADEEHPFGHGRIEYISAFIVAFLVIEVGFSLFKTSFGKIRNPEPMIFQWLSVGILILSVGVKLWLGMFNRKLGKRIDSKVMMATAADSLGDVAATTATIVSMLVFGVFGVNVDGIVGLAVSVVVMIAGVNIAKDTLAPLIGEAIDPEVYREITRFVESYDGIVGSHDLIVHNYGPGRSMASIHAEVPREVDVETSHEIIDRVERDAVRKLNLFLVIHMDPIETKNEKVDNYRQIAAEALDSVDSRLSLHDFRIVDGREQVNLIFDLVVPRDYTPQMRGQVKERVAAKIREKISNSSCVITVENSYCAEE